MKSECTVAAGFFALLLGLTAQGAEKPTPEELRASWEIEALICQGLIEIDPIPGQLLINDQILQILRDEGRLIPASARDSDICGKIDG